jgi:hypothetical protein
MKKVADISQFLSIPTIFKALSENNDKSYAADPLRYLQLEHDPS